MARLIEVQNPSQLPSSLTFKVGDLLLFRVSGAHTQTGNDVLERLGPYPSGLLLDGGQILMPEGPPNTVFFLARQAGQARIDVVSGGFGEPLNRLVFDIVIEP